MYFHGNARLTTVPYRQQSSKPTSFVRQGLDNNKPPQAIRMDVNSATSVDPIDSRCVHIANNHEQRKKKLPTIHTPK